MSFGASARLALLSLMSLLFIWTMSDTALAQADPVELSSEKAQKFLDLMSDPEVKAWLERKVVKEQSPASVSDALSNWEEAIRARLVALASVIPRIPQEFSNAAGVISRDVNSGRPGLVAGILAILIIEC